MAGKWYFDESDKTISVNEGEQSLEVCCVSTFDTFDGRRYYFGEKSRNHAELLTSAPALLEALNAAKSKIECSQRSHERASAILVDEALEIIDAAIALARPVI